MLGEEQKSGLRKLEFERVARYDKIKTRYQRCILLSM